RTCRARDPLAAALPGAGRGTGPVRLLGADAIPKRPAMESNEYATMFDLEDHHWWYLGLRDLVTSTIARLAAGKTDFWILDAGCGTGKLLEACSSYRIFGLELSPDAFPFLRRRGLDNVVRGSVLRMPFPDERFDLVVSNDVICCVETPGDERALREMGRVLR